MLRTFALQQLNVLRNKKDVLSGKQKRNRLTAAPELFYLMTLMVMAGVGGDELKNWMQGKTDTIEDEVLDNILKLFLLNKYTSDKIIKEAEYKGIFESLWFNVGSELISFPPAELLVFFLRELEEYYFGDGMRKSRAPSKLPGIGRLLYMLREPSEKYGIGGRGRDDYVYRSINAIYKIAEDRQLTQDELSIYWEIIQDVKKYPQKKMVKGKEKNKIKLNKHETMYSNQIKAFKKLPESDFIKKYPKLSTEFPTFKEVLKWTNQ